MAGVGTNPHINHCCSATNNKDTTAQTIDFHCNVFLENNRRIWSNQQIKNCQNCWNAEQSGNSSRRQLELEWLIQHPEVDEFTTELLCLDLVVGNLCNAACIMCGPISSSLWQAELSKVNGNVTNMQHKQPDMDALCKLDLTKLKRLYLVGGETLINKNTKVFLEEVKRQQNTLSNLHLRLQTNGSNFNDKHLLSLMKQCGKVTLHFSLDAIDKEYEYIRYPLSWKEIEDNVLFMSSQSTFEIDLGATVGVHNIDCLPNLYEWAKKLQEKFGWSDQFFGINPVYGSLAFDYASLDLKKIWLDNLYTYKNQNWANRAILMIQNSKHAIDNSVWINHLITIDRRRGLNWQESLSLLSETLKKISHDVEL